MVICILGHLLVGLVCIKKALKTLLKDVGKSESDHDEEWLIRYTQYLIKRCFLFERCHINQSITRLEENLRRIREDDFLLIQQFEARRSLRLAHLALNFS